MPVISMFFGIIVSLYFVGNRQHKRMNLWPIGISLSVVSSHIRLNR